MRNTGLDILRLIAVSLVLFRHLDIPPEFHGSALGTVLETLQRGGWVGVDLFFVLSGFLISSLLFNEYRRRGQVDLKRFLIRRGFKIYPAFWFFIAICFLVTHDNPGLQPVNRRLAVELLFIQNYISGLWLHTWSLAVEEHFYFGLAILVACLLYFAPERKLRSIPLIFGVVSLACLGLRWQTDQWLLAFSERQQQFATHVRIDSLFAGVVLSYAVNLGNLGPRLARIPTALLIICGVACFVPAYVWELGKDRWLAVYGFSLLALGGCCLCVAATRLERTSSKPLLGLAGLGAASYSIYLWHVPVNEWGTQAAAKIFGLQSFGVHFVISVLGALLIGWLMSKLIETPVLRLRDALFPSRAKALAQPAGDVPEMPASEPALARETVSAHRPTPMTISARDDTPA